MKRTRKVVRYFLVKIISKNLRRTVLLIGIFLTLWRGYECLQKFYNSNLSTRVNMVSSTETISPVIVVCPHYWSAYKEDVMAKYGIKDRKDYMYSNLQGNDSSIDEKVLYEMITHNFTEIVSDIFILFKNGDRITGIKSLIVHEKR